MIKYWIGEPLKAGITLRLERGSEGASGYDLMANVGSPRVINPGERLFVGTGIHLEMPLGVEAQIRTRSGLCLHHGVIVLNAPGTIDSDYRGELGATLYNAGVRHVSGQDGATVEGLPFTVHPGDRVAQLVFARVIGLWMQPEDIVRAKLAYSSSPQRVTHRDMLSDTARGAGGHGSTGR